MLSTLRKWRNWASLPAEAKNVAKQDAAGIPINDPGNNVVIDAATDWLCRAQDNSITSDGGVSRHFSLIDGWGSSYPETTGYIIPTIINVAHLREKPSLLSHATRMLDWCQSIQLEGGGFQGGKIDATPIVPVTFNTGQILLGLVAGVKEFDDYTESMHRAARFLCDTLDADGCWRKYPTPFANAGEKAYETHVSWGLFEAERIAPGEGYGEVGLRQTRWALTKLHDNGWVDDCCLTDPNRPLTHTLGYFLRGVVEAHRLSECEEFLDAARKTAIGLMTSQRGDGALPGRLLSDWTPAANWTCLTGNVQIAESWLYLYTVTNDERFARAAFSANEFVRRTIFIDGEDGSRGGVKGSFPVDGGYGSFEYLNWAAKFTIDSCLSELTIREKFNFK